MQLLTPEASLASAAFDDIGFAMITSLNVDSSLTSSSYAWLKGGGRFPSASTTRHNVIYSLQQPHQTEENNSCCAELSNSSSYFRNAEAGSIVDSKPRRKKGENPTHLGICSLNYLQPCSMQASGRDATPCQSGSSVLQEHNASCS